jgi:hypothetical protein
MTTYIVSGTVPQPVHRCGRTQFDHHPSTTLAKHARTYAIGEAGRRISVSTTSLKRAETLQDIFSKVFTRVEISHD